MSEEELREIEDPVELLLAEKEALAEQPLDAAVLKTILKYPMLRVAFAKIYCQNLKEASELMLQLRLNTDAGVAEGIHQQGIVKGFDHFLMKLYALTGETDAGDTGTDEAR